uniref:Uncharacterized protein n=1 Tax=Panagrolaimus sp. JU765 TaxID=591449 RepID=A0AC34QMT6_9BILA
MLYSYHLKPTLTQVTVMVPKGGNEFPPLTVCGFSPIIEHKMKPWNMSKSVLTYLLETYEIDFAEKNSQHEKEFLVYKAEYEKRENKSFNIKEFFNKTGPECADLVKACYWRGDLVEDCCSWSKPTMTDHGKCIHFHNSQKRRQSYSGFHHGFEVVMDSNAQIASELPLDPFAGIGAKVYVHEGGEVPQIKSSGISVPPGMRLYVGLDVQKVSLLPKTNWGRCQPDWDPKIHGHQYLNRSYSAAHCELNCKLNLMMENCGCVPLSLAVNVPLTVCVDHSALNCSKQQSLNLTVCNCSVECSKTEYSTLVSYSNLRFTKEEKSGIRDLNYAKENFVGIVVYMKDIIYEHHEQQRQVQTADLLSNIAGSMGLFLGMSTITLLEIFIYLFKSIWGTVNTERQKQFVKSVFQQEEEQKNNLIDVNGSVDEYANSETDEIPKDSEAEELSVFRKPSEAARLSVVSQARRPSYGQLPGLERPGRRVSYQALAIDFPRPSEAGNRLSAAFPNQDRRLSNTELFRAARRPSANFLNPTTLSIRRGSAVPNSQEIHVQVFRRPSFNAAFQPDLGARRKSTYNTSLI